MKIFIDFDDVLFNTRKFKQDIIAVFEKNGVSQEKFRESYWGKTRDLDRQIKFIQEKYNIDTKNLEKDLVNLLTDLSAYIFDDVLDFLKSSDRENMYVVSFGFEEFQRQKIKNSALEKYFQDIVITDKLKSEAIGLIIDKYKIIDQELYFLDDRSEYLGEVKNKFPEIKTVLIKRPEGRYDDDMDKHCDFEAKNLQQVEKIIHGK